MCVNSKKVSKLWRKITLPTGEVRGDETPYAPKATSSETNVTTKS